MAMTNIRKAWIFAALSYLAVSCAIQDSNESSRHRWWSGLDPVIPHDTFPQDCRLCHVGEEWHTLVEDFAFDHERETGIALVGAHERAKCLLCHNDRGPVEVFQSQGCVGCHEDVHYGELGTDCRDCHNEYNWRPEGQIARHATTRFPLVGAHAVTSCDRCHLGAFVGNFIPVDTECLTCHQDDVSRTTNPPHLALGWVNECQDCHQPTRWNQGRVRR